MSWKNVLRRKNIEVLLADMAGEHQLRRVFRTNLANGARRRRDYRGGYFRDDGSGRRGRCRPGNRRFVQCRGDRLCTGRAVLCGICRHGPHCRHAYTYAYATLGELFAWIIGWDLMLEYAMSCATVAASWTHYLNELLASVGMPRIPAYLISDPFTDKEAWFNLPGASIMLVITVVLVRGIRESAVTNAVLVMVKLGVVLFVIGLGSFYINPENWTSIPVNERLLPEEVLIPDLAANYATDVEKLPKEEAKARALQLTTQTLRALQGRRGRQDGVRMVKEGDITQEEADARSRAAYETHLPDMPTSEADVAATTKLLAALREQAPAKAAEKWGMLGLLGLNRYLVPIDDATRSSFVPYGISGLMLGASLVFFAFIGFDAVSTQAEEAPTRSAICRSPS